MAAALNQDRPFLLPVHALIMPSRIPADLLVHLRAGLPEAENPSRVRPKPFPSSVSPGIYLTAFDPLTDLSPYSQAKLRSTRRQRA
jgi:hypothetical protein